jgi:hypothetical protein
MTVSPAPLCGKQCALLRLLFLADVYGRGRRIMVAGRISIANGHYILIFHDAKEKD